MQFRQIGNTGMNASVVGLGAEHLDNKPYAVADEVIGAALENGINIIDVFMPGTTVRENIAKALGPRRKDVLIQGHIGSVDIREQYDRTRDVADCEKYFENLLRCFKTETIDLGMMFYIDTEDDFREVFDSPYIDYVQKLKRDGKIRAIGASSHDAAMAKRVVETGMVEMMMFSINLAYDMLPTQDIAQIMENPFDTGTMQGINPERAAFYALCESKGVGLTVMKTLGAGKLLSPEHTPFGKPMTAVQCIHYALTRPAVASALIGCANAAQVREAVSYVTATDAEKDYSEAANSFKDTFRGACVYCNHCQPCPSDIDIAAVNRYLDIARLNEAAIPPSVKQHYNALKATAGSCIECSVCEGRCPFKVAVVENMSEAKRIFDR